MGWGQGYRRTRRGFLHGAAGVGAGIAATGFAATFGLGAAAAAGADGATIVDLAATAEGLAATLYYTALTGASFHIEGQARESLGLALDAELRHLQILASLGGAPTHRRFYLPDRLRADAGVFVRCALQVEAALTSAYLAATQRFAELGQPLLAATVAQLGASEAQHLAQIRHLAGLRPSELPLPGPTSRHGTEASPALAPFLAGGAGFVGPVPAPSAAEAHAALGTAARTR